MWACVSFIILFSLQSISASSENQSELNALTWPTDVAYDEPTARQLSSFESFLNGGGFKDQKSNKARGGDTTSASSTSSLSSLESAADTGQDQSTSSGKSGDQNTGRNLAPAGRPLEYHPTLQQTVKPLAIKKVYPLKQFLPGYAKPTRSYSQVASKAPIGISWSRNKGYSAGNNKVYVTNGLRPKVYVATGNTYVKQPVAKYYRPSVNPYKGVTNEPIGYLTYRPSGQPANSVPYVAQVKSQKYSNDNNKLEYSEINFEDSFPGDEDYLDEVEADDIKEDSIENLVNFKVEKLEKVANLKADKLEKVANLKADKLEKVANLEADKLEKLGEVKQNKLDSLLELKQEKLEKLASIGSASEQLSDEKSKSSSGKGKTIRIRITDKSKSPSKGRSGDEHELEFKPTLQPMAGNPQKGYDPFVNTQGSDVKVHKNSKIQPRPGTELLDLRELITSEQPTSPLPKIISTKDQQGLREAEQVESARGSIEDLAGAIKGAFSGTGDEGSVSDNLGTLVADKSSSSSDIQSVRSSKPSTSQSSSLAQNNTSNSSNNNKNNESSGKESSGSSPITVKFSLGESKNADKNRASLETPIIARALKSNSKTQTN